MVTSRMAAAPTICHSTRRTCSLSAQTPQGSTAPFQPGRIGLMPQKCLTALNHMCTVTPGFRRERRNRRLGEVALGIPGLSNEGTSKPPLTFSPSFVSLVTCMVFNFTPDAWHAEYGIIYAL
ncbi:hypothetical protein IEO21_01601 [Rhodonia placenta]|uniref:Uncharacterized protein n=1 Tax=Rhodonia placenta TaxID=104341 RepID=A0A8H7P9L9_9APHY|nr:hypothetical protein IEO21_01601 [Postia placenta]